MRDFSGSERSVAGYLMAEVLERQPPEVRELLLRTSILDRVTGRLADAMTGHSDSERILLELEEANAFVTSLDIDRTWFRYHHLFADFLRLELRRSDPPASTLCTAWPLAGTRSTDIRPRRSGTRRRQRTGRTRRACSPTATSASSSTDGSKRWAGCWRGFLQVAAGEDAELAIVLAAARLFAGRPDETEAYIEVAERFAESVSGATPALRPAASQHEAVAGAPQRRPRERARGKARGGGGAGGPIGKRHRSRGRPPRRGRNERRHHRAVVAANQRGAPPPRGGSVPGAAGGTPLPRDHCLAHLGIAGPDGEARSSTGCTTRSKRSRGPRRSAG